MNEVRREIERAQQAEQQAQAERAAGQKKRPVRGLLKRAVLRRTSTKR